MTRATTRRAGGTQPHSPVQTEAKKSRGAVLAELKNLIGLRRLRLRRDEVCSEQSLLAATAQNLKRLVRFLSQPKAHIVEATA